MNEPIAPEPQVQTTNDAPGAPEAKNPYEKPTLTLLGTLRELTRGGISGVADGKGGQRSA